MSAGLEGRVAIVTGGANGLGRQHSLLLASHGVRVVVNDLGGATDGSGADTSAAQVVVDEIIAAGGEAVASTDSVSDFEGARRIVETAIETFGDLHIVINNAGILRDRMLVSMSEAEFDDVIAVHLKGTFNVSHHAAAHWRERAKADDTQPRNIVNTSSGAGLHGNVGQTNYAAAKAGIAAMSIVHSQELARYGVKVNCIAPIARTRLTLQTPGMGEAMGNPVFDPENVSPLVVALAHANCPFTGQAFSVYGGDVGIYAGWSIDSEIHSDEPWTVESIIEAMDDLPRHVKVNDQMSKLASVVMGGG